MPQINNAPRKPEDDELPGSEDAVIHIDNLKYDPHNVREESPSATLIKDISDMGFMEPLTTWEDPKNEGEYFITDGWQRYQSAIEVGFNHLPIEICKDRDEATRKAESRSRGKAWGDVEDFNQDYVRIKIFMEDGGLSESEAIDERTNESNLSRNTVKKNYEIAQLPKKTKELLKDPEERSEGFHDEDWKVKGTIGKGNGSLNKKNAHHIAKRYINGDLSDENAFNFALRSTRNSNIEVLEKALENYTYEDMCVQEAFNTAKDQVTVENNSSSFQVSIVQLDDDEKELLGRYIRHNKSQSIKQYFNNVVKEEKDRLLNKVKNDSNKYKGSTWAMEDSKSNIKK